ncbi:MAG: ATP-binding protein [Desulfovibrionaceae bacterium]|nr:ATP-binding protein [Desulfovibrionaceae bacterium]
MSLSTSSPKHRREGQTAPPAGASSSMALTEEEESLAARRRRRELGIAAAAFGLMLALIFIQLRYFGSGSILFFALFNLNVLLLIGILIVVLRNAIKIILERKQRIIGSRLRTRLILVIAGMTLIPCLLMFLVTTQFVKLSVDFWFKNQVESAMEAATDLTDGFLQKNSERLRRQAENILKGLSSSGYIWGGPQMDAFLSAKSNEYNLILAGFLDSEKFERNWRLSPALSASWKELKGKIRWEELAGQNYQDYLGDRLHGDFLYGLLPIDHGRGGYLVLSEDLGDGFQDRQELVAGGFDEYRQLRNLQRPIKSMLYLTLSILTSLIMLSIIWFALKMVKGLTDPILVLVDATGKLARGEENVRVEDSSDDEISLLVNSFNSMASEIMEKRQELTATNAALLQRNLSLDQQRQYVETVLDNLAAGVISFNADWKVSTINRVACQILGQKAQELVGLPIRRLLNKKELTQVHDLAQSLASNHTGSLQRQFKYNRDGHEYSLLATVAAMADSDQRFSGAVVVFEDVTELEKMQRMAAWQEVARRIAHEIKNPLTPIKLSAQRLEKKFAPTVHDPVFVQSTQLIIHQVEQLQSMVQEFSAFAKMPTINLKRGRPGQLLTEVFDIFRQTLPVIGWSMNLPEDLPELNMDEAALHRAFMNILTNAAEALDKTEHPAVFLRAKVDQELKRLRVEVGDNGPDLLSEEERGRLFEPYFSRKKGGTGLGLTIVRSIIIAHLGSVRASRLENGGTLVTVELPL